MLICFLFVWVFGYCGLIVFVVCLIVCMRLIYDLLFASCLMFCLVKCVLLLIVLLLIAIHSSVSFCYTVFPLVVFVGCCWCFLIVVVCWFVVLFGLFCSWWLGCLLALMVDAFALCFVDCWVWVCFFCFVCVMVDYVLVGLFCGLFVYLCLFVMVAFHVC